MNGDERLWLPLLIANNCATIQAVNQKSNIAAMNLMPADVEEIGTEQASWLLYGIHTWSEAYVSLYKHLR